MSSQVGNYSSLWSALWIGWCLWYQCISTSCERVTDNSTLKLTAARIDVKLSSSWRIPWQVPRTEDADLSEHHILLLFCEFLGTKTLFLCFCFHLFVCVTFVLYFFLLCTLGLCHWSYMFTKCYFLMQWFCINNYRKTLMQMITSLNWWCKLNYEKN